MDTYPLIEGKQEPNTSYQQQSEDEAYNTSDDEDTSLMKSFTKDQQEEIREAAISPNEEFFELLEEFIQIRTLEGLLDHAIAERLDVE